MGKKDKGWDYLNSDDVNSMSDGNKDDYCYTHSDGSGSYYGADGSWGYKNSDGSGSYHGADGSWGYKSSDGSASYHGADGSWGYKNSDGSISYHGADESYEYKNSDYFSDNDSSSNVDEHVTIIDGVVRITEAVAMVTKIMAAGAKAVAEKRELEAKRESERKEDAQKRSENRRAWIKNHKKGISILVLILLIGLLSLIGYYEFKKLIPVGYSSSSLEGLKYTEVVEKLKESGFTNVKTKEIPDLTVSREDEENMVTDVKLGFKDSFKAISRFPSNLMITVVYHTVELYSSPLTSKEVKGMNYIDVVKEFENAGYTNIKTEVKYDSITGWLTNDGEVKSVTIDGKKKYDSYDEFRLDAEVIVTYCTIRKNKPK